MTSSGYSRRQAIGAIGGLISGGLTVAATPWSVHASGMPKFWLTGGTDGSGQHGLYRVIDNGGFGLLQKTPLRLHAPAVHPLTGQLVAVARSTGDRIFFGGVGDLASIPANQGRHFYGHCAFSNRGDALFVGENDYDSVRGVISLRDPERRYKTRAEFSSGGLAPHEVIWHRRMLIAANGGLETHPETGRQVLNLDTMQSNAAVIDPKSGLVRDTIVLGEGHRYLSLRHMAAHGQSLYLGAQDQARDNPDRPLLFQADLTGKSHTLPMVAPLEGWAMFRGYIGSVAVDRSGQWVAATSPRGGVLGIWSTKNGLLPELYRMADVCGVAPGAELATFMVTTGLGEILAINMARGGVVTKLGVIGSIAWDNHLSAV